MEGIDLLMDNELAAAPPPPPPPSSCLCRICHEEEEESSTRMESPCACSGTLKFAHRECVQRWCDEKGSNFCEICLQPFEPNYTFLEKKAMLVDDVEVTIRESMEISRPNYDPETLELMNNNASDHYASSKRSASLCRAVVIMLTVMLLIRHFIAVVMVEADEFAFGVLTMFLLRACGILLPFYLVMRLISVLQRAQLQYYQLERHRRGANLFTNGIEEHQHQTIQVQA